MRDDPFLSLAVSEHLGAGHEEDAPPRTPASHPAAAVHRRQHRTEYGLLPVEILEPCLGGALVVPTVEPPVSIDDQVVLHVQEQVVARHHATGKEVTRH